MKKIFLLLLASFLCSCSGATLSGEYAKKFSTTGNEFFSTFSNDGYQFNDEDNIQKLNQYFSSKVDYEKCLSSVTPNNLIVRKFNESTILQFGSGSNSVGSLKWDSDYKIYKVEATVRWYSKYDSYDKLWIYDSWGHFCIDDVDQDLTDLSKQEPFDIVVSKSYSEGTNEFTLSSYDGRVFLKDLTITWKA